MGMHSETHAEHEANGLKSYDNYDRINKFYEGFLR